MAPATAAVFPDQEGTFSMQSHNLSQLDVCFDDTHAVANAEVVPGFVGFVGSSPERLTWEAPGTAKSEEEDPRAPTL
jgi:hypothetical protein